MANESAVPKGVILTIVLFLFHSDLSNIYASGRNLPSSASLITDEILSSVPQLPIESNAQSNMNGIVSHILHPRFTTKSGNFGESCDSASWFMSEGDSLLHNYTPEDLQGIRTLWLCIDPSHEDKFVHLGHKAKFDLFSTHKRVRRSPITEEPDVEETTTIPVETMTEHINAEALTTTLRVEEPRSSVQKSDERTNSSSENIHSDFRTSGNSLSDVVISDSPSASSTKSSPKISQSDLNELLLMESASSPPRTQNIPITSGVMDKGLKVQVFGIRVKEHSKGIYYNNGTAELQADYDATLLLLGKGFDENTFIQFTARPDVFGGRCDVSTSEVFQVTEFHENYALVNIKLPEMQSGQKFWYVCIREGQEAETIHQGSHKWLTVSTYGIFLPLWVQVIILVLLLILSGLFSGLNLGLMALDKTELKIVSNTGTPDERRCAKAIEPVRRHGNFLLCTLLLGNVLVNSSLTILLDTLSSGLIAVIGSTIGIVIFGEIVPQAICSRHGLAIGAKTAWLVRIFMVLTGPISWPISKILDYLLGEELGSTYDRERLKELIRVQDNNDIRVEEQNIIYGALELHKKTVGEVMTRIEDIFMLCIDINLDFNTINDIMQQGYSRVPIFDGERTNIVSVLFIKDLAFIDPDDKTPLRTLSQFYQNVCNFVFEDTTLDIVFKEFKEGNKGHMAFVHRVNSEGDCDPFYEVIGLVTLEDVIEELIQEEIVDETDVFTDNKTKRRRKHVGRKDFKEFFQSGNTSNFKKITISPQLQVAAFQFLRTTIEPFKENHLSEGILKRMLTQDIIHVVKSPSKDPNAQENMIFSQGKAVDYFVLVLEGHVEVTIGKENLTFESGPFTYFGMAAIQNPPMGESPSLSTHMSRSSIVGSVQSLDSAKSIFVPDYSVKATTEVTFLKVRRPHYIAARRAFLLEQSQKDPLAEESFEKEMEKILRAENLNSPVWEVDPENTDKVNSVKDTLLNGGTVRSKSDQDDMELNILRGVDNRRRSLRETLTPQSSKTLEPRSSSEDDKNSSGSS